jgi:hypothetical protein
VLWQLLVILNQQRICKNKNHNWVAARHRIPWYSRQRQPTSLLAGKLSLDRISRPQSPASGFGVNSARSSGSSRTCSGAEGASVSHPYRQSATCRTIRQGGLRRMNTRERHAHDSKVCDGKLAPHRYYSRTLKLSFIVDRLKGSGFLLSTTVARAG